MNIDNKDNDALVCADKRFPIAVTFIKGIMPMNDE